MDSYYQSCSRKQNVNHQGSDFSRGRFQSQTKPQDVCYMRAILKNNLDVVKLLLENGADVDLRTAIHENSSFEVALKEKQNSILKMLLHHQL